MGGMFHVGVLPVAVETPLLLTETSGFTVFGIHPMMKISLAARRGSRVAKCIFFNTFSLIETQIFTFPKH